MQSRQLAVALIVAIADVVHTFDAKSSCWSGNECLINSTTIVIKSPSHLASTASHNCKTELIAEGSQPSSKNHCHGSTSVSLNGCRVDRTITTIGTEYVSEPNCVQSLLVEEFPSASIRTASFEQFTGLVDLVLHNNAISYIHGKNLYGLNKLEHLELRLNNLYTIANETFSDLRELKNLTIVEPTLPILRSLRFGNAHFIHIHAKSIEWPHLPDNLIELNMHNTIILVNLAHEFILFENMYQLRSVSLCVCNLTEFPMIKSSTMETLNFTGNTLNTFVAHQLINLITFDISRNKLPRVSASMLSEMHKLKTFLAFDNVIAFVDENAFVQNPMLKKIDFTNNRLRTLDFRLPVPSSGPRIIVNGNPWSCAWLSRAVIDQHQLFVYFEFKSQKMGENVLGLQCTTKVQEIPQTKAAKDWPASTSLSPDAKATPQSPPPPMNSEAITQTNTTATTTTIITLLSVALVATIVLVIILYAKHRQHVQPFRPHRVDGRGNFLQNCLSLSILRRRGGHQTVDELADSDADNDFHRAFGSLSVDNDNS